MLLFPLQIVGRAADTIIDEASCYKLLLQCHLSIIEFLIIQILSDRFDGFNVEIGDDVVEPFK